MRKWVAAAIIAAVFVAGALSWTTGAEAKADSCQYRLCGLEASLSSAMPAKLAPMTPSWLANITTFNYEVETRGDISVSLSEFKAQVDETLNDNAGWIRAGLWFKPVTSGGDFVIVLAEASTLPSFSSGCTTYYSCRVGRYVIVNQDRWLYATDPWNQAGGNLRDYRHMVINHEVGHFLGHDHATCGGNGQLAPVMQQQSSGLYGCLFNPWPLKSELWVSL